MNEFSLWKYFRFDDVIHRSASLIKPSDFLWRWCNLCCTILKKGVDKIRLTSRGGLQSRHGKIQNMAAGAFAAFAAVFPVAAAAGTAFAADGVAVVVAVIAAAAFPDPFVYV